MTDTTRILGSAAVGALLDRAPTLKGTDRKRVVQIQRLLDDAQPLVGMDEGAIPREDPDVLRDCPRHHPEHQHVARTRVRREDLRHDAPGTFGDDLARTGLAPIPTIGWHRKRLVADHIPPDPARQTETIVADTPQAGLVVVRRPEPSPSRGNHAIRISRGSHNTPPE